MTLVEISNYPQYIILLGAPAEGAEEKGLRRTSGRFNFRALYAIKAPGD